MAGGMTAGRSPARGQPVARTAAGGALLGRSGPRVPSGPSAPPPVEEVPAQDAAHVAPPRAPSGAAPREAPPREERRHCWVLPDEDVDPGGDAGSDLEDDDEPYAGVVVEWRLASTGWQARVVYASGEDESLVETWLAADQLRPA